MIRGSAISSAEVSALDRNAEYLGVSTLQLMENAGRSVADVIANRFGAGSSVMIYGGTGRNGGDGMVVARHLAGRGFNVSFRMIGDSRIINDPIVLQNWLALKSMPSVALEECRDSATVTQSDSDVVVDAVLGTGVKSKLRQPSLSAVEAINRSRGFKVAVDVPTGINADSGEVLDAAVHANLTVTFHAMKTGLLNAKDFCGEVSVADIGIPPEASLFAGPGDVDLVTASRPLDAHKGQFGRLLIIGGSETFSGAPTLVALAAYRVGTDLTFVAAPEKTALAISAISPNLITIKLPGENFARTHIPLLREQIAKSSAIALGPGLGLSGRTASGVNEVLALARQLKKPILLDADAIKALKVVKKKLFHAQCVLTPHAGEYQSISGKSPSKDLKARMSEVRAFASRTGGVVLLKGHVDVISDGQSVKLNGTGNPGMTVGGTGDVLSGIVAGLMAQGIEPFKAAVAGAFVSGAAGDLAEEHVGDRMVPTDILRFIPKVMMDPMCHKEIQKKRLR